MNKMSNSNQRCCICLNSYLKLNELSIIDDNNVTFLKKLQTFVPEIEWLATYHICDPCIDLLRIDIHTFRETCIKSDTIRKQEKESVNVVKVESDFIKLEHNDDSTEADKIHLDIKNEDDNFVEDHNNLNYDENIKGFAPDIVEEEPPQPKGKRKVLQFQCERCPNNYVVSTALVKHCIQEHGMERKSVRPFACIKCTSRFSTSSNLLMHVIYHKAIPNTCIYCGKGFVSRTDLNIHEKEHLIKIEPDFIKREHNVDAPTQHKGEREVLKFQCERCPNNYVVSTALVKHCVQEHGMERKSVRPFACIRCTSRFSTSSNLLLHVIHHDAIPSNTSRDLRSQQLVLHTDPQLWKYFCEICIKPFSRKSNYDYHMRRHTGNKRVECHLCNKRFTEKYALKRHLPTHSDISLKCSVCEKEYKVKKTMQIHMAKIHGICDKNFSDKSYVKRHKKTHDKVVTQNEEK